MGGVNGFIRGAFFFFLHLSIHLDIPYTGVLSTAEYNATCRKVIG